MEIVVRKLRKKIPVSCTSLKRLSARVLSLENIDKPGEINICLVNDRRIRQLNLKYLGKDSATDVLAFDNSIDRKRVFADIVISVDTAIRNARAYNTSSQHEIHLYLIHGILHILGYRDDNLRHRGIMFGRTNRIMKKIWASTKPKLSY